MTLTTYTYDAIADWLGNRTERPARYATTVREQNGCMVVRHHATDILTITPADDEIPVVQVDTRGWRSPTTCTRLNHGLMADHESGPLGHVGSDGNGGWVYTVAGPARTVTSQYGYTYTTYSFAYHYAYADGMVIDRRPGPTYGHPMPAHRIPVDRNGRLLKYAGPGPVSENDALAAA